MNADIIRYMRDRVNAKILGMTGKIRGIASGYYADISGRSRALLTDPNALLDCAFVMKDGIIYQTESSLSE